jgi:hypothetical protein
MEDQLSIKPVGKHRYKIITQQWGNGSGWGDRLAQKLEEAAADGWRPILYGESGGAATVVCEKYEI